MTSKTSGARPRDIVFQGRNEAIHKSQADEIIKNLGKRNFDGIYFERTEQAVASILSMIPDGALVGLGGSESIVESGLVDGLRKKNIRLLDRYKEGVSKEEAWEMRKERLSSDIYISSSNAVTMDGKIVNMDGTGNRVAAMVFGPDKVLLLVGMNKIVKSVEDAVTRIKNYVAPRNAIRVNIDTPCSKKGFCQEPHCKAPHRICSQLVILESNMFPGRIKVFLVGEDLGYWDSSELEKKLEALFSLVKTEEIVWGQKAKCLSRVHDEERTFLFHLPMDYDHSRPGLRAKAVSESLLAKKSFF